jgi:hypothetical protein
MTQFPRINLNGTHGPQLLAEYVVAMDAVQSAIDAVKAITCHGRDYYPISKEAAATAFAEHQQRLVALEKVRSELLAIALNISAQVDARTARRDA